ncbi:suppressor of fused domain protein [Streptomyces sp. NPDC057257]|uniref:suppressor of fused domain protein n=1 Tax=Streptomyces sp. NPDC057257 TaxID=3346071 RepID=UPI00363945C4
MTTFSNVSDLYVSMWGEPLRQAVFRTRDGFEIGVSKWRDGEGDDSLTFYRTSGASEIVLPDADERHRQEFFVACDPECDDVAESLAEVGVYSVRSGKRLGANNTYRSSAPLWPGTKMVGYVVVNPFEGELQSVLLSDGRHVDFLMLIPAFSGELEYASGYGVNGLARAQEVAGVSFWDPFREEVPLV